MYVYVVQPLVEHVADPARRHECEHEGQNVLHISRSLQDDHLFFLLAQQKVRNAGKEEEHTGNIGQKKIIKKKYTQTHAVQK